MTATDENGQFVQVFMRPAEARKIGMDMIDAAHASVADSEIRLIAQRTGHDGDEMIRSLRQRTDEELP
jgi:hypothetical protein